MKPQAHRSPMEVTMEVVAALLSNNQWSNTVMLLAWSSECLLCNIKLIFRNIICTVQILNMIIFPVWKLNYSSLLCLLVVKIKQK